MSQHRKLFWLTTVLVTTGIVVYVARWCCHKPKTDLSKYRIDGFFGKSVSDDSPAVRPFSVNISDAELQDLKYRLNNARYTDHIEDTQFTYGFNSKYLKQVVQYWATKYDWRKAEAKLNSVPQFLTQIEGIDVHFIHLKPSKPAKEILPLLIVHGWPGSVFEYYKSLPLLTEPDRNGLAFEVIVPSIPGYGFSEAPHRKGFDASAAARVFVKLLARLGHDKFVIHGGDWGNIITRTTAILYPQHIIGAHIVGNWDAIGFPDKPCQLLKTLFAGFLPNVFFGGESRDYEYSKLFPLNEKLVTLLTESGYMHLQATKPDTIGAALVDSPVGLAAYILEKFSTWTNLHYRTAEDGKLTAKFTLDELLTNVMIYWTSGNIASTQRFYKENLGKKDEILGHRIVVPAGTVDAPQEILRTPRKLVLDSYTNLVQYTDLPRGGHFTAFEEPELVVEDLRSFVSKVLQQQQTKPPNQSKKHDEI